MKLKKLFTYLILITLFPAEYIFAGFAGGILITITTVGTYEVILKLSQSEIFATILTYLCVTLFLYVFFHFNKEQITHNFCQFYSSYNKETPVSRISGLNLEEFCKEPPRPSTPCTQRSHLASAASQGVDGLRRFIAECRNKEGDLLGEAEKKLNEYDNELANKSKYCIDLVKKCDDIDNYAKRIDKCIGEYAELFPSGIGLAKLEADKVRKLLYCLNQKKSDLTLPPQTKKLRCLLKNAMPVDVPSRDFCDKIGGILD